MTVEACIAFACASLAVSEVAALSERLTERGRSEILELLVELDASHSRLRVLFASEADDEVCGLALSILVLADCLTSSLE